MQLSLKAMKADDSEATLLYYRIHDFRVTCETRLAHLGFNQEIRDAVLGHAKPGLQKTYNKHGYYEEKKMALATYAKHLLDVVKVSKFDADKVRELAEIPIQPSRGRRQSFLPFENDKLAFRRALQRAERAYDKASQQQSVEEHCIQLKSVFQEEKRFAHECLQMICAWKNVTELARKDIAATADYLSAVRQHGDHEELLASRSQIAPEALVAHLTSIITDIQTAADTNGRATLLIEPRRKKDKLGKKSMAPVREFSYQLKLHWDKTMRKTMGTEFDKKFAFSTAHELVFKAITTLTNNYNKLEVTRIIRSLQTSNYNPETFRTPPPEGIALLKLLRPQLAVFLSSARVGLQKRSRR